MLNVKLKECIGKDILRDRNGHFLQQDPDQSHFILHVKAICVKYFTLRLHHVSKLYNQGIHSQKIRNHPTKTITFLGQ